MHSLRFPLLSFWQHSFQRWFVFVSVLVHIHHTLWWGRLWWGHRLRSEWKEGRENARGKTRRDTERQKVKWKTSLPLPLGLISFGPPLPSPSNHHQKQSAAVSASNPVMWLQICFQQGQDRKWESREKVNEQERMSDSSLLLHVHHSTTFYDCCCSFHMQKGRYFYLSLKGAEATKWPV